MINRRFLLLLALAPALAGCAVGDGLAHLAKLAGEAVERRDPPAPPTAAPAVPTPAARTDAPAAAPPPAPVAAPRDSIRVETLPAP